MIVLSNTTGQTLAVGQSITFNTVVMHTGTGECHRPNTTSVKMKNCGIYKMSFSGNISAGAAGNVAQLVIEVGGEPLPETTMKFTTESVNALGNVATTTAYRNCCDDYSRITVTNNGTVPVIIDPNPVLFVKRVS